MFKLQPEWWLIAFNSDSPRISHIRDCIFDFNPTHAFHVVHLKVVRVMPEAGKHFVCFQHQTLDFFFLLLQMRPYVLRHLIRFYHRYSSVDLLERPLVDGVFIHCEWRHACRERSMGTLTEKCSHWKIDSPVIFERLLRDIYGLTDIPFCFRLYCVILWGTRI